MKEKLYTIPMNDAVNAADECPFCFLERKLEQDAMDFTLGSCSSYMEDDVRAMTDSQGFCRTHFNKMFVYGNTLGNGWILKTHLKKTLQEMQSQFLDFNPGKPSFRARFKGGSDAENSIAAWIDDREKSCFICNRIQADYVLFINTFFHLWKHDAEFVAKIKASKGFCLTHYGDLVKGADEKLSGKSKDEFYSVTMPLMERNFERLYEDVSWLVDKFDYRNKDADWKNSRDSLQRAMQKEKGGYPADPPYRNNI